MTISQNIIQTFRDPLSGYKFILDFPFKLQNRWAIHPAYNEDFSTVYKFAKDVLIHFPNQHNLETKRLVFGILLYKLSEMKVVQFRQFKSLEIGYSFFDDKKFLARFFWFLPIFYKMPLEIRRRYPRFNASNGDISDIKFWLSHCITKFNKINKFQSSIAHTETYDERFFKANAEFQKWKTFSPNNQKLPKRVIRYALQSVSVPQNLHETYNDFFTLSGGELWIKHKSKSTESIDLFWDLLECIDYFDLSDYQNSLLRSICDWLKAKANDWTAWEPSFDSLLLDHRLSYKKQKALANIQKEWTLESANKEAVAQNQKDIKKSIEERIAKLRARNSKPIPQFEIIQGGSNDQL